MSITRTSALLLLLLLLVAACGGDGGGAHVDAARDGVAAHDTSADGAPSLAFADLRVVWNIVDVAGDAAPCPDGFPTAVIVATPADGAPRVLEQLACADGLGTGTYELGTYAFEVDVANLVDKDISLASLPVTLDLTADAQQSFTLVTDGGYAKLAWQLVGATSGAALTCAQAGVASIAVAATPSAGSVSVSGSATTQTFACAEGSAISAPIVAGTYDLVVGGVDGSGSSTGAGTALPGEVIVAGGKLTSLGTVTVPVAGK